MGYKKRRLGPRLVEAAKSGERYRDVHVFFGGTGAVGGTALLQTIDLYEEMFAVNPPAPDDVPVLVATGVGDDIRTFTRRLFRWVESRYGAKLKPRKVRNGYLTHSGVFVALERFRVVALPGLENVRAVPAEERRAEVGRYLESVGTSIEASTDDIDAALRQAFDRERPFSAFLEKYRGKLPADRIERFRSVVLGIPLPSLIAYYLGGLETLAGQVEGLGERLDGLRDAFQCSIRDDVARMKADYAQHVLVAHTTAVGGMFDEVDDQRTIRLGFAHSAVDERIYEKQRAAEKLTKLYAAAGIDMLITAAAIGVDEVQVNTPVPIHHQVQQKLFDAPRDLFPGSREAMPEASKASKVAGRPVPRRQMARCYKPLTVSFDHPTSAPASFERGEDIRPSYVIRSGENGYFTVANSDALYRVMRVASASELGQVLATCGLLGDDPQAPWFEDHICYYTQSDNSRQVFDFLAQPMLRRAQTNGLDPMSLQDLGSSKHQGELHTLGLLILLHRLRTMNIDAIPPYVDLARFDAHEFFVSRSRPLLFEDVARWDLGTLAKQLRILVSADTPEELEALKPFATGGGSDLFPAKGEARRLVLDAVLKAVWQVTSLGSPVIYEEDGVAYLRCGYFAAPLDLLVTDHDSVKRELRRLWTDSGAGCSFERFRDYLVCSRGFIDLRPHAIVTWARGIDDDLTYKLARAEDETRLRSVLGGIEPYTVFSTCGLLATLHRLRALERRVRRAMIELGTLQDFRWYVPRDDYGHALVLPGVVEAFRMVSEGLEKTTGTERLDGEWGYERRVGPDRRGDIPMG